jgi:hypothetical protein
VRGQGRGRAGKPAGRLPQQESGQGRALSDIVDPGRDRGLDPGRERSGRGQGGLEPLPKPPEDALDATSSSRVASKPRSANPSSAAARMRPRVRCARGVRRSTPGFYLRAGRISTTSGTFLCGNFVATSGTALLPGRSPPRR